MEYLTQEAFREGKGKGKSLSYKGLCKYYSVFTENRFCKYTIM